MSTGSVFENNRTQAVRLPADSRFPNGVKRVRVRKVGRDRILSPVENTWDSFSCPRRVSPTTFCPNGPPRSSPNGNPCDAALSA